MSIFSITTLSETTQTWLL